MMQGNKQSLLAMCSGTSWDPAAWAPLGMAATGDCGSGHWPAVLPETSEGTGEKAGGWRDRWAARAGIPAGDLKRKVLGDSDIKRVGSG